MEYMDVRQASIKWNVTERKVTALCRNKRIAGATKKGKLWLIPDYTNKPLDGRTREYAEAKSTEPIVNETTTHYTEVGANLNTIDKFKTVYKKPPEYTAFTPYRICPIGAHADNHCVFR